MASFWKVGTPGHTAAILTCLWMMLPHALAGQTQAVEPGANAGQPVFEPMTTSGRLRQYLTDTFNPVFMVSSAASAGIGQWRDRPPEWKQGSRGFGRRFASSYAEHLVNATLLYGASSVLHEDNRYLRSGEGGTKTRLRYAVESAILARHEDGSRHASISKIFAFAGAALISRTWQPASSRSFRSAGINFGTSMGVGAGFNVAREFLPDLWHRKVSERIGAP